MWSRHVSICVSTARISAMSSAALRNDGRIQLVTASRTAGRGVPQKQRSVVTAAQRVGRQSCRVLPGSGRVEQDQGVANPQRTDRGGGPPDDLGCCDRCRFFEPNEASDSGWCHLAPPAALTRNDTDLSITEWVASWPQVAVDDWCGTWQDHTDLGSSRLRRRRSGQPAFGLNYLRKS